MPKPKNQHFVPRCYLKQFVDPGTPPGQEPYVWIFDKGSKQGKRRAPQNILTETDLYTFTVGNGVKDYTLEHSLSQLENEYALVYENAISKKRPLDIREHLVLCAFVAAMLQRTLKQKELIEGTFDQLIERTEEVERQRGIPPSTSLGIRKARDNAHRNSIVQGVPEIASILVKMNLAFMCAEGHGSFITSDAPCYLFNAELQWQRFSGPGLEQEHVEVRMPLSPNITVLFSWVYSFRGYLGIGKDQIHEQNRMVFGHSHKQFIGNSHRLKRTWFWRFPLDPVFVWRIIKNEIKEKVASMRHRKHV